MKKPRGFHRGASWVVLDCLRRSRYYFETLTQGPSSRYRGIGLFHASAPASQLARYRMKKPRGFHRGALWVVLDSNQ